MTLDVKNFSPEARNFLFTSGLAEETERQLHSAILLQGAMLCDIVKTLKSGGSTGDKLADFVFAVWSLNVREVSKKLEQYKAIQAKMENHVGEYMMVEIWEKHGDDVMYACGTHELKATYICLIKEGMNFSFDFEHTYGTYNASAIYLGNSVNDDSDVFKTPKPINIASDPDLKYNFIVGDREVRKKLRSVRLSKTMFFGDNKINVLNFKMYTIMNLFGRNIPNMICKKRLEEVKLLWVKEIEKFNAVPDKKLRVIDNNYSARKKLERFTLLKNISTHAKLGIEVVMPSQQHV